MTGDAWRGSGARQVSASLGLGPGVPTRGGPSAPVERRLKTIIAFGRASDAFQQGSELDRKERSSAGRGSE